MNEYAVLLTSLASIVVVSITSIIAIILNKKTHEQGLTKDLYARKVNVYEESVATRELIVETLQALHFTLAEFFMADTDEELSRLDATIEPLGSRFQIEYEENQRKVNKTLLYLDSKIEDLHHAMYVLNLIRAISANITQYHTTKGEQDTTILEQEIKDDLSRFNETLGKIRDMNMEQIKKMRKDLRMSEL